MSQERFDERRRTAFWRRVRRYVYSVLVLALVGAGIWAFWFSTLLTATQVEVVGMRTLSGEEITEQAAVPLGGPLARINLAAIETRVAQMERIGSVDAGRHWPHAVRIAVKERVPIAWTRSEGLIRQVDKFGVDFRTLESKPDNLVEVRIETLEPQERQKALESVAAVVSYLRADARDILNDVDFIEAATQDSIRLRLSDGRRVMWGSAERNEEKMTVLRPLLKVKASRYDVSAPELPTTKK